MRRKPVCGSGTPRREFLHVDDLADACLFLMQGYEDERIINVGVGEDVSIAELAADPLRRRALGAAARAYAEENLAQEAIMSRFQDEAAALVGGGSTATR